jgi:hypothetical protein
MTLVAGLEYRTTVSFIARPVASGSYLRLRRVAYLLPDVGAGLAPPVTVGVAVGVVCRRGSGVAVGVEVRAGVGVRVGAEVGVAVAVACAPARTGVEVATVLDWATGAAASWA